MSYDALKALHTAHIDAIKGYEEAIADTNVGELKALFAKAQSWHRKAHQSLHVDLVAKGERPDDAGSFMATVHKTVISIRSPFGGLDHSSLDSFASGEQRIVDAYDDAMMENSGDQKTSHDLDAQKNELLHMITEMRRTAS